MEATMRKNDTWTLWSRVLLILLLVVDICVHAESSYDGVVKECEGTETGLSHTHTDARFRYADYRAMYTNCTHVQKNLEIVYLEDDDDYDLSFLSDIREVSGYVLVFGNHIAHLPLTSLRVIRGKSIFRVKIPPYAAATTTTSPGSDDAGLTTDVWNASTVHRKNSSVEDNRTDIWTTTPGRLDRDEEKRVPCSLFVASNAKSNSTRIGLKEIHLTALHEIMDGDVVFVDNPLLCYVSTIDWQSLLGGRQADVIITDDPHKVHRKCEDRCHENCTSTGNRSRCWGQGSHLCQQLMECSPYCRGNCYTSQPSVVPCCDAECVGGCSGPLKSHCWSCRNFNDSGTCVEYCPPERIYNRVTWQWDENPHAKFAYHNTCIKDCRTVGLLADNGGCVRHCGHGRVDKGGRCTKCDGACPKTCNGTNGGAWVDSLNIASFNGCTVINGSLQIMQTSFTDDIYENKTGITVEQLDVFESVREITEFLYVDAHADDFTSLSFLRNLRVIHGRKTLGGHHLALTIHDTKLKYLGLTSLQEVKGGNVAIYKNDELCHVESFDWTAAKIIRPDRGFFSRGNADEAKCRSESRLCSPQCKDEEGCWGPVDTHCRRCANYRLYDGRCVAACNASVLSSDEETSRFLYVANTTLHTGELRCRQCHPQCNGTCYGDGEEHCSSCRNFKDGPYCVSSCPDLKYPDADGVCRPCHANCRGCTGPSDELGPGGCLACSNLMLDKGSTSRSCLNGTVAECPIEFYFFRRVLRVTESETVMQSGCRPCHKECTSCLDGSATCGLEHPPCRHFQQGRDCVTQCSDNHYIDQRSRIICLPCHRECLSCTGPSEYHCEECRFLAVYQYSTNNSHIAFDEELLNSTVQEFYCSSKCPEDQPHHHHASQPDGRLKSYCASEPFIAPPSLGVHQSTSLAVSSNVGVTVVVAVVVVLVVVVGCFAVRLRRSSREQRKLQLTAEVIGMTTTDDDEIPMTDTKPDMALLRVISDSELRLGEVIGSGAFGTVYAGIWIPAGENVKLTVAVKVLREGTASDQNRDLLEEARIMASVNHPYCVRIAAVCMTAQLMLVTQLMQYGCALDFIRRQQSNISSKLLLRWAAQIASGMGYLEQRGIIHRDLAARNVLVQTPYQIRITDFGLATLLNYSEENFTSTGGKLPIKWLALESLQHRIFTHKTDVWSYGVTLWELFTYGQRPYESVRAHDMCSILEKGERLSQPAICTIDVYMLMIKCWMVDAESRPAFTELYAEFSKMSKDPGRYLVIPGDKLMRQPSYMPDQDQLIKDFHGCADLDDVAPDAVSITVDEYLNPQDVCHRRSSPTDVELMSSMDDYENTPMSDDDVGDQLQKARPKFQRVSSLRYSADPCRDEAEIRALVEREHEATSGGGGGDRRQTAKHAVVPANTRRPRTDNSDYLLPMSSMAYLDIIDDTETDVDNAADAEDYSTAVPAVINPEYFEKDADKPWTAPGLTGGAVVDDDGSYLTCGAAGDYYDYSRGQLIAA